MWRYVLESHGYISMTISGYTLRKDVISNISEIRHNIEKYGVNTIDMDGCKIYDYFWKMDLNLIDVIASMGLTYVKGDHNLFWTGWSSRGIDILGIILKYDVNYVYINQQCEMFIQNHRVLCRNIISYTEAVISWCVGDNVGCISNTIYKAYHMLLNHKNNERRDTMFFKLMYDKLKDDILAVNPRKIHIK